MGASADIAQPGVGRFFGEPTPETSAGSAGARSMPAPTEQPAAPLLGFSPFADGPPGSPAGVSTLAQALPGPQAVAVEDRSEDGPGGGQCLAGAAPTVASGPAMAAGPGAGAFAAAGADSDFGADTQQFAMDGEAAGPGGFEGAGGPASELACELGQADGGGGGSGHAGLAGGTGGAAGAGGQGSASERLAQTQEAAERKREEIARTTTAEEEQADQAGSAEGTRAAEAARGEAEQSKAAAQAEQGAAQGQGQAELQNKATSKDDLRAKVTAALEKQTAEATQRFEAQRAALDLKLDAKSKQIDDAVAAEDDKVAASVEQASAPNQALIQERQAGLESQAAAEKSRLTEQSQREQETLLEQGEKQADQLVVQARAQADRVSSAAGEKAREVVRKGETEAKSAVDTGNQMGEKAGDKDAEARANQAARVAQQKAEKIRRDAAESGRKIEDQGKQDAERLVKDGEAKAKAANERAQAEARKVADRLRTAVGDLDKRTAASAAKMAAEQGNAAATQKQGAHQQLEPSRAAGQANIEAEKGKALAKLQQQHDDTLRQLKDKADAELARIDAASDKQLRSLEKQVERNLKKMEAKAKEAERKMEREVKRAERKAAAEVSRRKQEIRKQGRKALAEVDKVYSRVLEEVRQKIEGEAGSAQADIAGTAATASQSMADMSRTAQAQMQQANQADIDALRGAGDRSVKGIGEEAARAGEQMETARAGLEGEIRTKWMVQDRIGMIREGYALDGLRGLSDAQLELLRQDFREQSGEDLGGFLREQAGKGKRSAELGLAYAEGRRVDGALAELRAAGEGAGVDRKHITQMIGFLSADEIAELRRQAGSDPEAAEALAEAGDILDQAEAAAKRANELAADVEPATWKRLGVNPDDPTTLLSITPKQVTDEIVKGNIDREAMVALLKQSGVDPGAYLGVEIASDPEFEQKNAGHEAKLLVSFLDTNLNGAMANSANLFQGIGGSIRRGANDTAMRDLQDEIRAACTDGKCDPAKLAEFKKRYRELDRTNHQLFNEKMDNLETAVEVAVVAKDVLKTGAVLLAERVGGPGGRALMQGALDGIETVANETILEGKPFDEALVHGLEDGVMSGGTALLCGKAAGRFNNPVAKVAVDNAVGILPKTAHSVVKELRENPDADPVESLQRNLVTQTVSAGVNTGFGALGGANRVTGSSGAGGLLGGKAGAAAVAGNIGIDIVAHNVNAVATGTSDEVMRKVAAGEDVDVLGTLWNKTRAQAESLTTTKGLIRNVASPAATSAVGTIGGRYLDQRYPAPPVPTPEPVPAPTPEPAPAPAPKPFVPDRDDSLPTVSEAAAQGKLPKPGAPPFDLIDPRAPRRDGDEPTGPMPRTPQEAANTQPDLPAFKDYGDEPTGPMPRTPQEAANTQPDLPAFKDYGDEPTGPMPRTPQEAADTQPDLPAFKDYGDEPTGPMPRGNATAGTPEAAADAELVRAARDADTTTRPAHTTAQDVAQRWTDPDAWKGSEGPDPVRTGPPKWALDDVKGKLQRGEAVSDAEVEMLVAGVVHDVRGALEKRGGQTKPGIDPLAANAVAGMCGAATGSVAKRLADFGIKPSDISSHQAGALFSSDEQHGFTTFKAPNGKQYIIDTTIRQFSGKKPGERFHEQGGEGTNLAAHLWAKGYAELTDKTANIYGRAFGAKGRVDRKDYSNPENLAAAKEAWAEGYPSWYDKKSEWGKKGWDDANEEFMNVASSGSTLGDPSVFVPGMYREEDDGTFTYLGDQ